MSDSTVSFSIFRTVAAAAIGIGLAWAIGTHSYVAYVAAGAPARALEIQTNSSALLNLVERRLDELKVESRSLAQTPPGMSTRPVGPGSNDVPGDRLSAWAGLASKANPASHPQAPGVLAFADGEQLRGMVRHALLRDPLSARGFRMLAQIEDGRGAAPIEVARLMRIAASRSAHETAAVWWLMLAGLNEGDYKAAIAGADTILRTQSRLTAPAVQVLSKASQTAEGMNELTSLLLGNPPWRSSFFSTWPQFLSDARAPLVPLLALRDTRYPPTHAELRGYMAVLLQNRFFDLAYYTWLQFLPPEHLKSITSLFNGSFELTPSGLPFDWVIPKGAGVSAGIVARPGAPTARALAIEFGIGRVDFPGVTQTVLLPSGSYRFEASYRAQISGRRGLVWQIVCLNDARTSLGMSPMILGATPEWKKIEFEFKVPDEGCPAQLLRLYHDARTPSEQLVTGWSFHDDVGITRVQIP